MSQNDKFFSEHLGHFLKGYLTTTSYKIFKSQGILVQVFFKQDISGQTQTKNVHEQWFQLILNVFVEHNHPHANAMRPLGMAFSRIPVFVEFSHSVAIIIH